MAKIRNMGTATMRFSEGVIITGSAGDDTHSLVITGSTFVIGDITCNDINIGGDDNGTGRTISAGNTDTSIRFNAADGVDIVVGGSFFISCDENASQDTIVVNETAKDIDFRIESKNNTHQFFLDAGNDYVLINSDTATPSGMGSDTSVFISGSTDGSGQTVFGGDVVTSGSLKISDSFTLPTTAGSQDQVLTSDGSGNVTWENQMSAPAAEVLKVGLSGDYTFNSTSANENQTVPFNTTIFDTFPGGAGWDTSNYKFISGEDGYYEITAHLTYDVLQSDASQYQAFIMTSGPGGTTSAGAGGDYAAIHQLNAATTALDMLTANFSTILYLSASHTGSITVRQIGGTFNTTKVRGTGTNQSFVCVKKL